MVQWKKRNVGLQQCTIANNVGVSLSVELQSCRACVRSYNYKFHDLELDILSAQIPSADAAVDKQIVQLMSLSSVYITQLLLNELIQTPTMVIIRNKFRTKNSEAYQLVLCYIRKATSATPMGVIILLVFSHCSHNQVKYKVFKIIIIHIYLSIKKQT